MPRKRKNPVAKKPAPMRWEFGPEIPTRDFLEEGPLDDPWNLQQAVENFVSWVEEGQFLASPIPGSSSACRPTLSAPER